MSVGEKPRFSIGVLIWYKLGVLSYDANLLSLALVACIELYYFAAWS